MPLASLVLLQSRAAFGLPTAPGDAADEVASRSLLERIGLDGAVEWLDGEENERLLAISRLAAAPNPRALRLLDRWLEDSSHWSSQELWTVAQALAPRAEDPIAQRWLFRILTGATPREKEALPRWSPLVEMAQQVAALGLAASGDANATSLLAKLLRRQTPASKIASAALLAHPPDHLGPLLTSPGAPTVLLVQTLERLGDQRAFSTLREFVRRGAPEIQAAAAVALLRLGHLETVELAEHWLEHRREPLAIVAARCSALMSSMSATSRATSRDRRGLSLASTSSTGPSSSWKRGSRSGVTAVTDQSSSTMRRGGRESTIRIVSTETVVTLEIRSRMYRGLLTSRAQSLGSLTMPEALSVRTW